MTPTTGIMMAMVQNVIYDVLKSCASLAWTHLGRSLSNPPRWLEDSACAYTHQLLESDCTSSALGTLKRWAKIKYSGSVISWSDDHPILTVSIDDPEQVDPNGIEEYFEQKEIQVNVYGDYDTHLWTVFVMGDIDDVRSVNRHISHAVERNRLRSGQTGVTQQNLSANLAD
ncbi:hypothetical protein [Haloterrigena salifodinae]|uniref:hypothetical protein n=1 Tax=Haloterrigena salifodinae TaxID=2675099 RepID=UPI000F8855F5|nr:hypothetical protein [Haloterrigena salifodinae]